MFIARLALSFALEGGKYFYHRNDRQVHRTPTCQSNSRQGPRNFRLRKCKSLVSRICRHRHVCFSMYLLDNVDLWVFASIMRAMKHAFMRKDASSAADHFCFAI